MSGRGLRRRKREEKKLQRIIDNGGPQGRSAADDEGDVMYAMAYGACYGCKRIFGFNPVRVPSVIVNGSKEPICQDCVNIANPRRIANGLDPIVPLPDAYEACDQSELD